jgi:hypothetical protein
VVSSGVGGFKPPTESTPVMHGGSGGRRPLTGGPRRGIDEADRWDPTTDILQIKNTSETKIAQ